MITPVHLGLPWLLVCLAAASVEAEFACPNPDFSPAGLHPDPANCSCYYQCSNYIAYHEICPGDLHFSPTLLVCDWPYEAGCVEPTTTSSTTSSTTAANFTLTTFRPTITTPDIDNLGNDVCEFGIPCAHAGECSPVGDYDYKCDCYGTGYEGTQCAISEVPCNATTCIHGYCAEGEKGYGDICVCDVGYNGTECNDYVCDAFDCDFGTICAVDVDGNANCVCQAPNYQAPGCERELPVESDSCSEGSTSTTTTSTTPTSAASTSTTTASTTSTSSSSSTSFGIQPNFIVFVVDDLGSSDVGWHPNVSADINTTLLQEFVEEYGVILDNYSVQPTCTTSRHALLFGRHEAQDGLQHYVIRSGQRNASPTSYDSLPKKLKEQNYKNYLIGKWHLGNYNDDVMPVGQGFDKFYGYVHGESDHYSRIGTEPLSCYDESGAYMQDISEVKGYDFFNGTTPMKTPDTPDSYVSYSTGLFENLFYDVFDQHVREHKDQPFFIDVSFNAAHAPLQFPGLSTPRTVEDKRRNYAAMVNYVTLAIRRMIQHVQDQDSIWQNTIVVFTTDNGGNPYQGASNYPLRGGKFTLFEGGLKGAGFVASPYLQKQVDKEERSQAFIHISDWYPTFVHLAGGNTTGQQLNGHIVWNDVHGPLSSERTHMLLTLDTLAKCNGTDQGGDIFDTRQRAGIRFNNWKLLTGDPAYPGVGEYYYLGGQLDTNRPTEQTFWQQNVYLFDLDCDPTESINLFESDDGKEEYGDLVNYLLGMLADYKRDVVTPAYFPPMDLLANPSNNADAPENPNNPCDDSVKSFFPWAKNDEVSGAPPAGIYCRPFVATPAICGAAEAPLS